MNIFRLLEADHRVQRDLVGRLADGATAPETSRAVLEQLHGEFECHAAAEEQTLYAEFLGHPTACIRDHVAQHDQVSTLLFQLREMEWNSAEWARAYEDFAAAFERHLKTEESELLPLCRLLLSQDRCESLGEHFAQCKSRELSLWGHDPAGHSDRPGAGTLAAVPPNGEQTTEPTDQCVQSGSSSAKTASSRRTKSVISSRFSRVAASHRTTRIS